MNDICRALVIDVADAAVHMVHVLLLAGAVLLVVLLVAVAVAERRRNRSVRRYKARLRHQSAPDYECEDCIGMREHGCYCQAMGARQPGGPL